jgi:hypothetical protein
VVAKSDFGSYVATSSVVLPIDHLVTMGELHRAGRYDRLTDGVERVTGRPAMSVREFVSLHADEFGGRQS